jgi:hypothetical protein
MDEKDLNKDLGAELSNEALEEIVGGKIQRTEYSDGKGGIFRDCLDTKTGKEWKEEGFIRPTFLGASKTEWRLVR